MAVEGGQQQQQQQDGQEDAEAIQQQQEQEAAEAASPFACIASTMGWSTFFMVRALPPRWAGAHSVWCVRCRDRGLEQRVPHRVYP